MSQGLSLDVVIVSHNDGRWLGACLRSLRERRGDCALKVIVVDNGDGLEDVEPEALEADDVLVVRSRNHGFAAGNNLGVRHGSAPAVLFLNPDTELIRGTLAQLVQHVEERPDVGAVAVRQTTGDGTAYPSLRRFPSVGRVVANALWAERWPVVGRVAGERELRMGRYETIVDCDWTTGAALLVRRSALESAGTFDSRFFMYSEETDLCKRIVDAGWRVMHVPDITVVHHAGKAGVNPVLEAQMAHSRMLYARKHFGRARQSAYLAGLLLHHAVRVTALRRETTSSSPEASRRCLRVLLGREAPPFAALTSAVADAGRTDEVAA